MRFHFFQTTSRSGIAPNDVVIFPQQLRADFPDAIHGYLSVIRLQYGTNSVSRGMSDGGNHQASSVKKILAARNDVKTTLKTA
jgi:hypothetical protein